MDFFSNCQVFPGISRALVTITPVITRDQLNLCLIWPSDWSIFETDIGKNVIIFGQRCQANVRNVRNLETQVLVDTLIDDDLYEITQWVERISLIHYAFYSSFTTTHIGHHSQSLKYRFEVFRIDIWYTLYNPGNFYENFHFKKRNTWVH